jgi:RecJ-like exonuclease
LDKTTGFFDLCCFLPIGVVAQAPKALLSGFISFLSFRNVFEKKIKQKEDERKRNQQEKAQEEKNRRADELTLQEAQKYGYIINCPLCLGNGECMVIQRNQWDDKGNTYEMRKIHEKPDDWSLNIEEGDWVKWSRISRREKCPGCHGEGIAHADFDSQVNTCYSCQGKGKIMVTTRIKKEIGSMEVTEEVVCPVCQGKDTKSGEVVHVKTLYEPDLGSSWDYDSVTSAGERKKHSKFDVIITDKNRDFFSKREQRKL